jgi:hypothetical protein
VGGRERKFSMNSRNAEGNTRSHDCEGWGKLDISNANVEIIVWWMASRRRFIQRLSRLLGPKPGSKEAVMYEIVLEKMPEEY